MSLILYSAVGGTDPISNNHDGSLLHICRHRKPDKVYILISMEMGMFQEHDQRYTYCLEQLGKILDHSFEVVLINEENLERPDSFDVVYPIIKRDITRIRSEMNDGDELIVNIASGTPAMKYCLQFLSALADYNFTPISVTTPERSINPHKEDRYNYDPEEQWKNNKDNEPDHTDRTYDTKSLQMLTEFYTHTLVKFIKEYNYSAALTFTDTLSNNYFPEDFMELLRAADTRLKFDIPAAQNALRKYGFELPYPNTNRTLFEYYLNLKIKLHKQEYADFIRAFTALLAEILEICIGRCGVELDKYTTVTRDGLALWSEEKLKDTEIEKILTGVFQKFNYGIVMDAHLRVIAESVLSKDEKNKSLYENIVILGFFEEVVRNPTTHEMISADPEAIMDYTKAKWKERRNNTAYGFKFDGITPDGVMKRIEKALPAIGIPVKKNDSYDQMNNLIISKIQ